MHLESHHTWCRTPLNVLRSTRPAHGTTSMMYELADNTQLICGTSPSPIDLCPLFFFWSVCCFSYKSSRLVGNERKLTIPLGDWDERKRGWEMWGGPTPLSTVPQTRILWPLPVPNLIPAYNREQSVPGLSLRTTGKKKNVKGKVSLHSNREIMQKQTHSDLSPVRWRIRRKLTWQCPYLQPLEWNQSWPPKPQRITINKAIIQ